MNALDNSRDDEMENNELFQLQYKVYKLTGWGTEDGDDPYSTLTSDYLLEKLPNTIQGHYKLVVATDYAGYLSDDLYGFLNHDGHLYQELADTPLKALLKLTLALHDAGELV